MHGPGVASRICSAGRLGCLRGKLEREMQEGGKLTLPTLLLSAGYIPLLVNGTLAAEKCVVPLHLTDMHPLLIDVITRGWQHHLFIYVEAATHSAVLQQVTRVVVVWLTAPQEPISLVCRHAAAEEAEVDL